jgi:hypothetical protein
VPRSERPYVRILILLLMAVVATLAAYLTMAQRMADPDQFWHIATGRWIVEHGAVPTVDVFSWWGIANEREWVAQSWLFGVLIYGVHALGGFAAVYWFTAMIEGLSVFVVYALARARRATPLWALLVTIASMFGTISFAAPRPQMLSFVLVPLTALLLEKGVWPAALAVAVLGANVHGGVWPLYVLVFLFYGFPRRWWLVALSLVAVNINPNPVNTFLYPLTNLLSTREVVISEFLPTVLWNRKGDLAMYVAAFVLTRRRRIPWRDGLLALSFVLLSLSAIRHVQWFYLIVLPVLAPYLSLTSFELPPGPLPDWLSRRLPARLVALLRLPDREATGDGAADAPADRQGRDPARLDAPEPAQVQFGGGRRVLDIALIAALLAASILLVAAVGRQTLDIDHWYPKDMVAYLKLHKAKRIFNIWHEGGYLIFHGIQPLIDGRGDPYVAQKPGQKDLVTAYMDVEGLSADPMPLFDELKVDYALIAGSPLLTVLRREPRLELVKTDEYHGLFKVLPKPSSTASAGIGSAEATSGPPGQWLRDAANRARPPSE